MCSGSEEGSYLRLIDLCISLNSRLESNKEEEEDLDDGPLVHGDHEERHASSNQIPARRTKGADRYSSQFKNNYFAEM